ncbi:MAG: DMT family transporter [Caulobacter sp.]|nr:DMT family transporter [Caulobacter sp.]
MNSRALPFVALILGACAIGFVPNLVRLADTGPAAAGFWRMALSLPILLPMMLRDGRGLALRPSNASLLAGLFFAGDLAFWHYGIRYTSVANATVLANLSPVVVTAVAWFAFKERPGRVFLTGLVLALSGAWTMAAAAQGGRPGALLGDLLSVTTALWYGLYFIAMRQARQGEGAGRAMFWSTAGAVPILLVVAIALGEPLAPASMGGWLACLGLAVAHVTGQGAIAWALGRLPTATASVVVLAQPVVAAIVAFFLFREILTPLQMAGGVLTLIGVVIAQRAPIVAAPAQRAQ